MRQLKGKVKETRREKRERKQDNVANKERLWTVVLPTVIGLVLLIASYVYINTHP